MGRNYQPWLWALTVLLAAGLFGLPTTAAIALAVVAMGIAVLGGLKLRRLRELGHSWRTPAP